MTRTHARTQEVYGRLKSEGEPTPSLVVGADTVVVLGDAILEKPKSEDAAKAMLARLSGGSHEVLSGVALIYGVEGSEPHIDTFVEKTAVDFGVLPAEVIDACEARGIRWREAGEAAPHVATCGVMRVCARVRACGRRGLGRADGQGGFVRHPGRGWLVCVGDPRLLPQCRRLPHASLLHQA